MKQDLDVFKAFSDETRLRILFLLSERELCVCELVAVLGMPQGKISRHLAQLRHAGLVADRRDNVWIYYSLSEADSELKHRLFEYLKTRRNDLPMAADDLDRLDRLVCEGAICIPRPPAGIPGERSIPN